MNDNELLKAAGEVLRNESSADAFESAGSFEEIRDAFARCGKALSLSEVERLGKLLNNDELSENELDDVRGGMTREILMIGGIVAAIVAVGACRAAYLRAEKDR